MQYSFEYQDEQGAWHLTKNKFKDISSASAAAGVWMEICYEHGYNVAVRLSTFLK